MDSAQPAGLKGPVTNRTLAVLCGISLVVSESDNVWGLVTTGDGSRLGLLFFVLGLALLVAIARRWLAERNTTP